MSWQGIDVPLRPWTEEDLRAALTAAPPGLCGPEADRARLLALRPCSSFSELLGQLYPTHAGNLGAAARLAERLAEPRSWSVAGGSIDQGHVGVVGDLEVEGDLSVLVALVVTGDLTVRGTLSDCGPESRIVVLGSLRCRHVDTSGWVTVVGDVDVEGVLKGSYNDDSFESHAVIRAGAILSDEHVFEAAGGLSPRRKPERAGVWGDEVFDLRDEDHVTELRSLLDDALDDAGELDWDRLPPRID